MKEHQQVPQTLPVIPEVTAGVYYSQAALGSDHLVLPLAESAKRVDVVLPAAQTSRAIGMAAIPEDSKGEQLNKLVYNGLTSEEYAARHNAWLANFAAQEQMLRDLDFASTYSDDEEDDDQEGQPSTKKRVGASR